MGWTSHSDLLNELTNNAKRNRLLLQKNTSNAAASAAGRSHELFTATGTPTAGAFSGTAGVFTQANRSTVGALDIGANVTPDTRHLLTGYGASPTATVVPATLEIWDLLGWYPACVVTGAATTLNNAAGLPTRGTGKKDIKALCVAQTAFGAAQPAITLTYTDQDGNTGNTASTVTAPANSIPISTALNASASGLPIVPLAGADTGIQAVTAYSLASGTTGTMAILLARYIETIPLRATNEGTYLDFATALPNFPQIDDDACLFGMLMGVGGAMIAGATVQARLGIGWG